MALLFGFHRPSSWSVELPNPPPPAAAAASGRRIKTLHDQRSRQYCSIMLNNPLCLWPDKRQALGASSDCLLACTMGSKAFSSNCQRYNSAQEFVALESFVIFKPASCQSTLSKWLSALQHAQQHSVATNTCRACKTNKQTILYNLR